MVIWSPGLFDLTEDQCFPCLIFYRCICACIYTCAYIYTNICHSHQAQLISYPIPVQCSREDYDWLEFFAGHAACTTYARLQGHRVSSLIWSIMRTHLSERPTTWISAVLLGSCVLDAFSLEFQWQVLPMQLWLFIVWSIDHKLSFNTREAYPHSWNCLAAEFSHRLHPQGENRWVCGMVWNKM